MKKSYLMLLALSVFAFQACPGKGKSPLFFLPGGAAATSSGDPATPTSFDVGGSVTGLGASETVTLQINGSETVTVSSNTSFKFPTKLSNGAVYTVQVTAVTTGGATKCMASGNFGTVASSSITNVSVVCSTTLDTLSVNVSNLEPGNTVIFQNNATNDLSVSANGSANFTTQVPRGAGYYVTVKTQPTTRSQICTPSSPSGIISAPTTVNVTCAPNYYTISGTFSGLAGSGLKIKNTSTAEEVIKNSGIDGAAGSFAFVNPVAQGSAYTVSVSQNPANLNQTCTVTNGTGTATGNVTNVAVNCVTNQYKVSGGVSGMTTGDTVTLRVNGGSDYIISATTPSFLWNLADGTAYTVSVLSNAPGKNCGVTNATGTIAGADKTNVVVTCAWNTYTVGGNVSGLCTGQSVTLLNNGGPDLIVNGNSPAFTFPLQNDLSAYSVSVKAGSFPANVSCTVTSGGTGNLAGANVTNVAVTCNGCMACNGTKQITANWNASRSYDADTFTGGGHKIYYDTAAGVSKSTVNIKDVPNTTSKISGVITGIQSGCKIYLKVGAYSSLNSSGGNLSTEFSVTTPYP